MRISDTELDKMYRKVGFDKKTLHSALIKMGKKHLKTKQMRDSWSTENPTKNYCYVISEFVYYYLTNKNSTPYKLPNIPNDDGLHRFVKLEDGTIIDLAVEQFENYEDVDYSKSSICYFIQNKYLKNRPSKRTRILGELCGYGNLYR